MSVSLRSEVLTMVTLNRLGVYPPDQSSTTPVWALGASLVRLSKVHLAQATWILGPRVDSVKPDLVHWRQAATDKTGVPMGTRGR